MHYYKSIIQYAGTNYSGFQWQKGIKTVQSELNLTISQCVNGKSSTNAASRTDRGVHAIEQIVKITTENFIECHSFKEKLNQVLPSDIRCSHIEICDGSFNPIKEAISKEYRYLFTNEKISKKEHQQFMANISNKLDLSAIQFCIQKIIGVHDFCNFYSQGSNVKSTIRTILECELTLINPRDLFNSSTLFSAHQEISHCYELKIKANGFLKQMIRHLVSALWMVGTGKISTLDFLKFLDGPKVEKQLWKVAPPNGLFLYHIKYSLDISGKN